MSLKDDQERCRSLVCDPNGIIVAEMVYRCMICFYVSDTMQDARSHYVTKHIEEEDDNLSNDNSTDQINNLDDLCQKNIPKHLNKKLHQRSDSNNSLENGLDFSMSGSRYRGSEPIDMSPSSDSFDHYLPLVTISDDSSANGLANGASKSGYVTCAVCNVTRFYSCVQKRYGQYTCVTCYRNFKAFCNKPEKHECSNLGKCPLNVRQRCKACWINKCIDIFQVDLEKQQLIEHYAPLKNGNLTITNSEEDEHTDHLDDGIESNGSPIDDKMEQSDDNNNSINGLTGGLNGHLNHSKDALSYMLALNGDLPAFFSKSSLNSFGLLSSNSNNLFGNLNVNDNNNNSLINHSNNSLNNQTNGLTNGTTDNIHAKIQNLFLKPKQLNNNNNNSASKDLNSSNGSDLNVKNAKSNGKAANGNGKNANGTAKKKLWSCGKCATCSAEDCGTCIYCLDRPKFGGPFVKKQRCIKRRCLMKIKNKAQSKQQQQQNTVPTNNLNTSFVF